MNVLRVVLDVGCGHNNLVIGLRVQVDGYG